MHNPKYLKYLLDKVFDIKVKGNIRFLDKELDQNYKSEKAGIVDLLIEFDNKIYIIELQNKNEYNLEDRILYYNGKLYSSELLKNEDYKDLKVCGILVLVNHDFKDNMIYDEHLFHSKYTGKIFSEKIDIRVFNLKYASIDISNNIKTKIAKFIVSNDLDKLDMLAGNDEVLKEMLEEIKLYNLDRKEYQIMTLWDEKFESEEKTMMRIMEIGKEEGRNDGLEQGRKEGHADGLQQGRKEGIQSGIKKVANKMLAKNMPIELISEMTGLSQKEIKKFEVNI
jgi:predicted transposase/invertase (TIGR01784 family)